MLHTHSLTMCKFVMKAVGMKEYDGQTCLKLSALACNTGNGGLQCCPHYIE